MWWKLESSDLVPQCEGDGVVAAPGRECYVDCYSLAVSVREEHLLSAQPYFRRGSGPVVVEVQELVSLRYRRVLGT